MKQIPLTQGKFALVDDEDFEYLNQWKWYFGNKGYVIRTIYSGSRTDGSRKGAKVGLHTIIMNPPLGMVVDHINGNPLDNRKNNLRNCTPLQNHWNRKVRGYTWHKGDKKYQVSITKDHKTIYIGSFKTKEEAKIKALEARKQYFKEFAR